MIASPTPLPAHHHPPGGLQRTGHLDELNGDDISDAGGGAGGRAGVLLRKPNIGDGYAVFEATHGTASKYAEKALFINPGSAISLGA